MTALAARTRRGPSAVQPADALVVFGITGDLARVMTFRSLYRLECRGLLSFPIVGVAVDDWTLEQLVERARASILGTGEELDPKVFERFAARRSYVQGDFADASTYARVGQSIEGAKAPVFYLELPPFLFARVIKGLAELGFAGLKRRPEPNQLVIKLDPSTGVRMILDARRADAATAAAIMFDVEFAEMGGEGATPYEVLLHAAVLGYSMRFTRQDQLEETSRLRQLLLDAPSPVHSCKPGSRSPEAAGALVGEPGGGREPWVQS